MIPVSVSFEVILYEFNWQRRRSRVLLYKARKRSRLGEEVFPFLLSFCDRLLRNGVHGGELFTL